MRFNTLLLTTALAPIVWGSTYLVTSNYLPPNYPITVAMLRALPAGLLMLVLVRQLPVGKQWIQTFILGALNFTIFWICLFIAAYQLPGGIAATLGAIQPIIVIFIAYLLLKQKINQQHLWFSMIGIIGVALVVLKSTIHLNTLGISAALIGAVSMALGSVLSKKWRADTPLLAFTAWQLTAGGLLLLPLSLYFESPLPDFVDTQLVALTWLSFVGSFLAYLLWFRGLEKLDSIRVSILILLSPVTAILLGWFIKDESLMVLQIFGTLLILLSIIGINRQGKTT